jgi:hypothetical protein
MTELDARLSDIQATVHGIKGAQSAMERRMDRSDTRMSELERSIIEVQAEQRGAEKVMTAEHVRLHEKVDGVLNILRSHTEREDQDRRQQIGLQWSTFLALAGALAWWVFERVAKHG